MRQLKAAGCQKIFREKITGTAADRLQLAALMDRFALATFDLFTIVKQIVDAKAQFRSLAEPASGA